MPHRIELLAEFVRRIFVAEYAELFRQVFSWRYKRLMNMQG